MQILDPDSYEVFDSRAYGISADGSAIVGRNINQQGAGRSQYRWTAETGMVNIGGEPDGVAKAVTANGTVVMGWGVINSNTYATMWSQADGMTSLGDLPGGMESSTAWFMSGDGLTVVGYGHSSYGRELVSNGFATPESIKMMNEFLDCITVDFKGNGEQKFVRQYVGIPSSQPVFDSLVELKEKTNIHVEITDLIVPKVGDDLDHAKKLCKFIYDLFGPEMPIHFLQFHPSYKMMDFEPTPVATLEKHYEIAKKEGLKYAYVGNVPGHPLEHTYCPECNKVVVRRYSFDILQWNLDDNNCCKFCGNKIHMVGKLDKNFQEKRFEFVF
jgi:hypothetical protein